MSGMPIDTLQRKIGSRAVAIVHYSIDSSHWEFRQETGNDVGRDCTIELSENDRWNNHKIEGQIKGSEKISPLKRTPDEISFSMETKTINYALGSPVPFVLFHVDITTEAVYYLAIQDYFISHPELFDKLETAQDSLALHIPTSNILGKNDSALVAIAKCTYIDGPGRSLKLHC
ncbi:MAG: DUF4365 domain-containing protein [Lachnospiraceae bacterium]|nr:DUF4365 domain-containing protein [Lachnospiraceae bacterium]